MAVVPIRYPADPEHVTRKKLHVWQLLGLERWWSGGRPARPRPPSALYALIAGTALLAFICLELNDIRTRLSNELINMLPSAWVKSAGVKAQALLDKEELASSQLPPQRVANLAARFARLNAPIEGAPAYQLVFRHARSGKALLISLPHGTIIVSDELLTSLNDDTEAIALLCQQLGYLQQQYALKAAINKDLWSISAALLFNREEWATSRLARSFLASRPDLPEQLAANVFARNMLTQNNISVEVLRNALQHVGTTMLQARALPDKSTQTPTNSSLQAI